MIIFVRLFSGIICNWSISLDVALILALKVKQFPLTNWPYSLDNILYLNHTLLLNAILTK